MALRQQIYHNATADIAGAVVSTVPSAIREISGENNSLADTYLQVFSKSAVPVNGTTAAEMLIAPILVEPGKRFDLKFTRDMFPEGLLAQTGIYICASSTKYTKTIVVAPTIDLTVIYEINR